MCVHPDPAASMSLEPADTLTDRSHPVTWGGAKAWV